MDTGSSELGEDDLDGQGGPHKSSHSSPELGPMSCMVSRGDGKGKVLGGRRGSFFFGGLLPVVPRTIVEVSGVSRCINNSSACSGRGMKCSAVSHTVSGNSYFLVEHLPVIGKRCNWSYQIRFVSFSLPSKHFLRHVLQRNHVLQRKSCNEHGWDSPAGEWDIINSIHRSLCYPPL